MNTDEEGVKERPETVRGTCKRSQPRHSPFTAKASKSFWLCSIKSEISNLASAYFSKDYL